MSDIIKLLPDSVANQIAAGEVIQRPASVVKELMENAIDAGAGQIKINIKDAGRTLVQIIDDGCGFNIQILSMDLSRPSWGLTGMEERAALFNGKFQLESTEGEGTRIKVIVPYQDISEEHDDDTSNAGG